MQPLLLFLAGGLAAAVLVIVNTVLLTRRGGGTQEAQGDDGATVTEKIPHTTEPVPGVSIEALSPELAHLRSLEGVRGVTLWGPGGALLLAEGDLLEPLLPEASNLMRAVTSAAEGIGSGRWASFTIEGVSGAIQGARIGDLSLVVVSSEEADREEIERLLRRAAIASRGSLVPGEVPQDLSRK